MVTIEHHHQNSSASPPQEHTSTAEQQESSMPIEMSQSQVVAQQEENSTEIVTGNLEAVDKEAVKSAVSQRSIDLTISKKINITQDITRKVLKLDLVAAKDGDELDVMSPKSPVAGVRLSHQTSLTSSVDVEDRKTLREALYQGIFHRHRRTIFAVGSFLRMLRSRNSQYNTIRSSSEGEDINEAR